MLTPVLRIIHRVIARLLIKHAGLKRTSADTGAVTLIQLFGSAANLNIQLHCLVLDGVYRRTEGEPLAQEARASTRDELQGLLARIIARLMKMLMRSTAKFQIIAILVNEYALAASLKDVPDTAMSSVERLRIDAVESPHARRQIRFGCFDQQVIVIVHQAVGIELPALLIDFLAQKLQKPPPILVIGKNLGPRVTARGEMVKCAGEFQSKRSDRALKLRRDECKVKN